MSTLAAEPSLPAASPPQQQQQQQHVKRRQYATGQTQAYYGGPDTVAVPQYAQPSQMAGQQLFTPGLTTGNQFAAQQQQTAAPHYSQQHGPEYATAPPGTTFGHAPGYLEQPSHNKPVDQLVGQFGQMSFGTQILSTANLLNSPPDPRELMMPPPEIHLPTGTSLSSSPHINAPFSYQRCTVNAFPVSSSLANKSKVPLALVINPYKSLEEGEEPVPLVSDTIIARCRRCRTYINPYVQFSDNDTRYVHFVLGFWLSL
jgi:protein transport protein SEC24